MFVVSLLVFVDSSPAPFFGLLARLFSSPLAGGRDKKCDRGDRDCYNSYDSYDDDCCRCRRDYDRVGQMLQERGGGKCNRRGGKKCNRRHGRGKNCDDDYKPSYQSYQPTHTYSSPTYHHHHHYHVPSYTSHYSYGGWSPVTSSYSSSTSSYSPSYNSWRKQDTLQTSQKLLS